MSFLVLGHPGSAGYWFCLVNWDISQIRHWLATYKISVPPLPEYISQAGQMVGQSFVAVLVFMVPFS